MRTDLLTPLLSALIAMSVLQLLKSWHSQPLNEPLLVAVIGFVIIVGIAVIVLFVTVGDKMKIKLLRWRERRRGR